MCLDTGVHAGMTSSFLVRMRFAYCILFPIPSFFVTTQQLKKYDCMDAEGRATQEQLPRTLMPKVGASRRRRSL